MNIFQLDVVIILKQFLVSFSEFFIFGIQKEDHHY